MICGSFCGSLVILRFILTSIVQSLKVLVPASVGAGASIPYKRGIDDVG